MGMKLDQDYSINGHVFKAGDNVDTTVDEPQDDGKTKKVDYADQLKEMVKSSKEQADYVNAHHGAVPEPKDPSEATAQTPTRPLGGPNLVGVSTTEVNTEVEDVHEKKDPGNESADK